MKQMAKYIKRGNMLTNTSLRNGGRVAGTGILYDDYSEESGNNYGETYRPMVRFPNDNVDPEELNGECIIVQKGRKKDG